MKAPLSLIGGVLLAACSSTGSLTTTVQGPTAASLKSVSSLPDLNITALDAATSSSTNIAAAPALSKAIANSSTAFSRAGCELRACVDEFKQQVKEFNGNKCIIEAMETYTDFKVGDGDYNYFRVLLPPDSGVGDLHNTHYRVRVGVIDSVLRLALCREQSSRARQTMAMRYEIADGKFAGTITNIWPSFQEAGADDAFRIAVNIPTDDPSKFSAGDSGSLTGQFNGFFGAGSIQLNIAKESTTLTNTVDASFRSGGDTSTWGRFTSLVYGKYNADEGCSSWDASGTYPAQTVGNVFSSTTDRTALAAAGYATTSKFCWKEADPATATSIVDWIQPARSNGTCTFTDAGNQCFTFSRTNTVLTAFVYSAGLATYYDDVVGKALGTFAAPAISFAADETWDCTAPADFTPIDVTTNVALAAAVDACFDNFEEAQASRSINSCEELARERDAEADTGGTFQGE